MIIQRRDGQVEGGGKMKEWCKRKGDGQSNGGWSEGEETVKEGEGMLRER